MEFSHILARTVGTIESSWSSEYQMLKVIKGQHQKVMELNETEP